MASGAGKGNFGSKFRNFIGGKKKQKPKYGSTGSIGSGDSDEEGYMDPEGLFATEPPGAPKPPIPDYPPPSCPGSKLSPKSTRPYSSIEYNANTNLNAVEARDHARTLDSSKRRPRPTIPEKPKTVPRSADDYSDPWDSKSAGTQARPSNYIDPYDSKGTHKQIQQAPEKAHGIRDNYIEPWDKKTQPRDMKSKHKDDYKDPWDTTAPGSLPKSSFEEDDDYTVPYDAGKPMPTLRTNERKPPIAVMDDMYDVPDDDQIDAARARLNTCPSFAVQPAKAVPESNGDYDEPWEQKTARIFQPAQKHPQKPPHKPAHSPAPLQAQQSPRDDYDAPWEWNNDSLTKAFGNLPPPSANQPAKNREKIDTPSHPQPKPPVHHAVKSQSSLEQTTTEDLVAIKVNPSIPLEGQSWYHGKISRFEAEALLKDQPDCSYLIRDSESSKTDFSLSLRNNNEPMHLKISCRNGKFILGQNSKPYDSIPDMINHYSLNTLNIRGAEQVKLIYPVIHEAMYFTVEPGS